MGRVILFIVAVPILYFVGLLVFNALSSFLNFVGLG